MPSLAATIPAVPPLRLPSRDSARLPTLQLVPALLCVLTQPPRFLACLFLSPLGAAHVQYTTPASGHYAADPGDALRVRPLDAVSDTRRRPGEVDHRRLPPVHGFSRGEAAHAFLVCHEIMQAGSQ